MPEFPRPRDLQDKPPRVNPYRAISDHFTKKPPVQMPTRYDHDIKLIMVFAKMGFYVGHSRDVGLDMDKKITRHRISLAVSLYGLKTRKHATVRYIFY